MRPNPMSEAPLLRLAVCLIVGILMTDKMMVAPCLLLSAFVGLVVLAFLSWKWPVVQSVAIAVSFVVLGVVLTAHRRASLSAQWPDAEVVYEGVVLSGPVEKPKTMAVDILLAGGGQGRKLKCYLHKDARSRALQIGDGLRIQSRIESIGDWRVGKFDYRRYLETNGFSGRAFVAGWKWQRAGFSLKGLSRLDRARLFFLKMRSRLLHRLSVQGMDRDAYGVVAAMVLGDKSGLSEEVRELYSLTGASHVLALSGLHLGIIYSLLSLLVVGRRWQTASQVLTVVAVWGFVFLVGLSATVVRSAVMLSVYALLSLGYRDRMSVNTLAFAAIVLLMANPYALYDVGFQMSFLAVFSILIWLPLLMAPFSQEFLMGHRVFRWVWGMVSVSLAAQAGVAPLIAYYFGRFSVYFLLTNFVVIPGAMLILYLSLAALVVPTLAGLLFSVVGGLNRVLGYMALLPGACVAGLNPSALQVSMAYFAFFGLYLMIIRKFCLSLHSKN